ncbi:MAG: hypothetical protein V8S08_10300 [Lachnoclostridium sp.]
MTERVSLPKFYREILNRSCPMIPGMLRGMKGDGLKMASEQRGGRAPKCELHTS